ncbi:hypothetical protein [Thalassiella azotivora]
MADQAPDARTYRLRRLAAVTGLALALPALAGCSLVGGGDEGSGGSGSVPAVELAEDGTVADSVATVSRPIGDYDVTVDVLRLHRFDEATRLELAITPRSRGADRPFNRNFFSANGYSGQADGIYLLDTANLKQYPVLRVSDEECVCSAVADDFELGKATVLFADFPAVPEDVSDLTVVLPRTGPLAGVEVTS